MGPVYYFGSFGNALFVAFLIMTGEDLVPFMVDGYQQVALNAKPSALIPAPANYQP